ncbi:MAG: hypothetical protein AMJ42_04240 [Deltaproteobacteria bacterium DG_8]|nr:MAG: hypothetical protein AMJ42_04240 [Deltaproteobacteria bacterium DG_8]
MKRGILLIGVSILISYFTLAEHTNCKAEKTALNKNLLLEYTNKLGFKKGQILNIEIVDDSIMKVYINECSFCSAFRDISKRNDIARTTLDWFLNETGQKKGTVEWYNSNKIKVMSISGSLSDSEIKWGSSCSIQ